MTKYLFLQKCGIFCASSFQNEINFQTRYLELFYPNPQDCSTMINQKETVSKKLQEQQDKLSQLEEKLSQLLTGSHRRRSADSGTITWSDEDTITTNKVSIYCLDCQLIYLAYSL